MAEILSMGTRSKKYCVARIVNDEPQYLKRFSDLYAWTTDITVAIQFEAEHEALSMASRVVGGAQVADMMEVGQCQLA